MSEKVREMFGSIANRYDFMNQFLSLGIHKSWRTKTVKLSEVESGTRVLDCASGTGDLAIEYYKNILPDGKVMATDFCEPMLDIAREKFKEKNYNIDTSVEDATNLTFEDDSFDIASISFGIRNVDSTEKGLTEMARVVKPGGKVVVLEFGQPYGLFAYLYKFYSKVLIPIFGKMLAKSESAYDYLQDTASKYPCREEFIDIMQSTDKFSSMKYYPVTSGIAYIYIGIVK